MSQGRPRAGTGCEAFSSTHTNPSELRSRRKMLGSQQDSHRPLRAMYVPLDGSPLLNRAALQPSPLEDWDPLHPER